MVWRSIFTALVLIVFILLGGLPSGDAHAAIYCGCDPCTCCTGDNCTAAPLACRDVTRCDPGPYGLICTTIRECTGGVIPDDCPDWFATCCNPCGKTNPTGSPDEPTSAPGEPTSRPTRIPTGATTPGAPWCGDGACGGGTETCASCPEDCGICVGTVRSRAVYINSPSPPCAEVIATAGLAGSSHVITANSWISDVMIQDTGDYVTFPLAGLGLQNLTASPPAGSYSLTQACWSNTNGSSGEGQSAMLDTGETLTFDVAFGPPGPWPQIQGGDVYASGSIRSDIPGGIDPSLRMFMRDTAANDNAGVLLYGAGFDFDTGVSDGSGFVSATNRRVKMDPPLPELRTVAMVGLFGVTTPL